jgi:hypothetical protein
MATPFPTVQPGDVWGQKLLDAITSRDTDAVAAAGTAADAKIAAKVGASTLILGPQDPVPANTPAGTVIFRTT